MHRIRWLMLGLFLLLVVAGMVVGGLLWASLARACDPGCLSNAQVAVTVGVVVGLSFFPLTAGVFCLLRWRAARPVARTTAGSIATALTVYVEVLCAVASWLSVGGRIHGDLAWSLFWTGGVVVFSALGMALIHAAARRQVPG